MGNCSQHAACQRGSTRFESQTELLKKVGRYWWDPSGKPVISLILVGVILGVFIAANVAGRNEELIEILGLHPLSAHSYLTYWVVHANTEHVAGNILLLLFLGPSVERAAGPKTYALISISLVLAGSLVSVTLARNHWTEYENPVGLSTMTYTLITAFVYMVTLNRLSSSERIARHQWIATGIAVLASATLCTLLVWLFSSVEGGAQLVGHISALVGGIVASIWITLVKSRSQNQSEDIRGDN